MRTLWLMGVPLSVLTLFGAVRANGGSPSRVNGLGQVSSDAFPRVAPAVPMEAWNRLLALPAAVVYGVLTEEAKALFPPMPRPSPQEGLGPWYPPPSHCPYPWDVKKLMLQNHPATLGSVYIPAFVAAHPSVFGGASSARDLVNRVQPAFDPLIAYACSSGLPIFGGDNSRGGEWPSVPPWKGAPTFVFYNWWAWVLRVVQVSPTEAEGRILGLIARYWKAGVKGGESELYASAKAPTPQEIFPSTYVGAGSDPEPFKRFVPYLVNQETFERVVNSYPWPGPKGFFWQAFMESASAVVTELVRRRTPLLSEDEARTAITLAMMSYWDAIGNRVEDLASEYEKRQKRKATIRAIAVTVVAIGAAVLLPVAGAALVGAAVGTAAKAQEAQAAAKMAEFGSAFETSAPAFSAEVKRVADMVAASAPPVSGAEAKTVVETSPARRRVVRALPWAGASAALLVGQAFIPEGRWSKMIRVSLVGGAVASTAVGAWLGFRQETA